MQIIIISKIFRETKVYEISYPSINTGCKLFSQSIHFKLAICSSKLTTRRQTRNIVFTKLTNCLFENLGRITTAFSDNYTNVPPHTSSGLTSDSYIVTHLRLTVHVATIMGNGSFLATTLATKFMSFYDAWT